MPAFCVPRSSVRKTMSNHVAEGGQEGVDPREVDLVELAEQGVGEVLVGHQVHEELLVAPHQHAGLEVVHPPERHHGAVGRLVLPPGPLGQRLQRLVVDVGVVPAVEQGVVAVQVGGATSRRPAACRPDRGSRRRPPARRRRSPRGSRTTEEPSGRSSTSNASGTTSSTPKGVFQSLVRCEPNQSDFDVDAQGVHHVGVGLATSWIRQPQPIGPTAEAHPLPQPLVGDDVDARAIGAADVEGDACRASGG